MNTRALSPGMLLAVAVLGGCANVSTDPREGGFFGGVSGINSGAYDARLRDRDDRLAQLRDTQRGLEADRGQLESKRSALEHEVRAEREKLKKLNSDVAALDKRVKTLASQQGKDQKRVKELQTRLESLKSQAKQQGSALDALEGSGVGDAEADLKRKQLEAQRDALNREYELLMKMQMELAR